MKCIVLVLTVLFSSLCYCGNFDEYKSLFKLGSTPFLNKSKLSLNFSYGINYGSPSDIIQQWILPDDKRKIMFNNIIGSISFANELEIYMKYAEGYSLAYNYSHIGINSKNQDNIYGVKWKFINSDGYIPDASVELNSEYPLSLSIGSSDETFKYYLCVDLGFYYIFYPTRYSVGAAYSFIDYLNLFVEGSYHSAWETQTPTQSLRAGIDLSLINYIHFDIALFYFNLKFSDIIPFRNGLTWQSPDYIMTMPEKNDYFLLSSSIYVSLDLLN